jgi:four helix bundle protein
MADPDKYGHQRLEIYVLSHALAVRVHRMTRSLPESEWMEEGRQIRRSSKSAPSNIVEGYALRKYKSKYVFHLHHALGSSEETLEHLKLLYECGSLKDQREYSELSAEYEKLIAKTASYIIGVERTHSMPYYLRPLQMESPAKPYTKLGTVSGPPNRESRIQNRESTQGR